MTNKPHCASFSVACLARQSTSLRRSGNRALMSAASLAQGARRRCTGGGAPNTVLRIGRDRSTKPSYWPQSHHAPAHRGHESVEPARHESAVRAAAETGQGFSYCTVIARGRGMLAVPHADAAFSVKLRRSAGTSQRSKSSKVERKAHPT
jgi:hypothetical protein